MRNYIYKYGEHIFLKEHALIANETGFSAAILFVCQQVLAVEEMVNTNAHSENAYFPHLRRYISDQLEPISHNPFSYNEFENIWRTLSKEIYSINQNDKCVTFSFDEVKGVNKAKRFPLGQALFTKEDVVRIIDAVGQSNLKTDNERSIFSLIRSNRSVLSRRGKRLITHLWLRHALVRQIKGLSKSIGDLKQIKEVIKNKNNLSKLHIKVYLDNSDWLNTEYVINVFDSTDDLVNDIATVNKYFDVTVGGNSCLVLVPHPDGDSWILNENKYVPKPNDELIVLFEEPSTSSVPDLLESYFGSSEKDISHGKFSRSKMFSYYRCHVNYNLNDSIYIKNGKIYESSIGVYARTVEYIGGITVNNAEDRYSCLYLPDSVVIEGNEYKLLGKVKINEKYYTLEDFREGIRLLMNIEDYKIEFEDGSYFKLKVAPRYKEPVASIGFTHSKGKFMPLSKLFKGQELELCTRSLSVPSYELYKKLKHYIGNSDNASISSSLKILQYKSDG